MSARALRRAQRELEERQAIERAEEEEEDEQIEGQRSEKRRSAETQKASFFALLVEDNEEEAEDENEEDDNEEHLAEPSIDEENNAGPNQQSRPKPKSKPKASRKKKRKDNTKGKGGTTLADGDDMDATLRFLTLQNSNEVLPGGRPSGETEQADVFTVLAIDATNLHAENEMRKLFGRAALEGDREEPAAPGRGRRDRRTRQMGLAGVVAGRNQPGIRSLATLGLRRNLFIQGKEDWPQATSGGLGMELVQRFPSGAIEYKFIHNSSYQDVQRQFESCVVSMDPNRMVSLLQYNPYHISTLLQVSEIAKQERDHATSGDLLERALFNFGRTVHSSFASSLSQGKARLDFDIPENREFWLAAWRYISNLGMRSTWRTALEWAKLLLSLDPEGDPYCVRLVIDQFALRARQPQQLLHFNESPYFKTRWADLPNIAYSVGLAHIQANEHEAGRKKLDEAMSRFPWVAARLFQELDLDPIPPRIWGKRPRNPEEELHQELYVVRAKDLWNTPEATSLLFEIASRTASREPDGTQSDCSPALMLNIARHTILTDNPALISLLPRSITSQLSSIFDPLPPE